MYIIIFLWLIAHDQDGSALIIGSPSAPVCLVAFPPMDGTRRRSAAEDELCAGELS